MLHIHIYTVYTYRDVIPRVGRRWRICWGGQCRISGPVCPETFGLGEKISVETNDQFIRSAFNDARHFGATEGACKKCDAYSIIYRTLLHSKL